VLRYFEMLYFIVPSGRYGNRWLSVYGFTLVAVLFAAMVVTYIASDADSTKELTRAAQGFWCKSAAECAATISYPGNGRPNPGINKPVSIPVKELSFTFDTDGQHADITATLGATSFSCKGKDTEASKIVGKMVTFPDGKKKTYCLALLLANGTKNQQQDLRATFDSAKHLLQVVTTPVARADGPGLNITLVRCSGKTPGACRLVGWLVRVTNNKIVLSIMCARPSSSPRGSSWLIARPDIGPYVSLDAGRVRQAGPALHLLLHRWWWWWWCRRLATQHAVDLGRLQRSADA
jgi:hypothetical protein